MGRALRWVGCVCAVAVAASGCGSGRSAEASFRDQANTICRQVSQVKSSVDFSSRAGFAKGLAGMRIGVGRLARLHPPPQDEPAYRDLLARLRNVNVSLDGNRSTLLSLERRLRVASGRPEARTIKRFRALVVPLARNGLRAAADARALGLGVCATDLDGGAPFGQSPGGGGQAT